MAKLIVKLGDLIEERSKKLGRPVTQFEIAVEAKLAPSTISRWLSGEVNRTDFETIEKLCAYFECPIDKLLYIDLSQN